jgi:glycosyltransferase XagB
MEFRSWDASDADERRAVALDEDLDRALTVVSVRSAQHLRCKWPKRSAATLCRLTTVIPLLLSVSAFASLFEPQCLYALSIIAVMPTVFRLWILMHPQPSPPDVSHFPPTHVGHLPEYTIIAPLRSEARVVDQLLSAIERLNYPHEKLDVILVVEADDHETRAAITARKHRIPVLVIPVPPTNPGTKPKALSVALPFARGMFTVIYDAEDRPEPNQLRQALKAFHSGRADLACVQARLCIDTHSSWLARFFTAEYAGHFDVFLPKLAALGLPLPLGGSSNHFKTEILRKIGGWDAYNVTEDADLGMRLARFGYKAAVIDSTTHEEAPADVRRWLGQRTRWLKGWMQTWLVHMREPYRLFRELGLRGFLTFQFIVGGNALVALFHSVFMTMLIYKAARLALQGCDWAIGAELAHYLLVAAAGYSMTAYLGWCGLSHRHQRNKFRTLIWTPLHWLLLSLAAWRAAIELITNPYFWKKTEHGLDQVWQQKYRTRSLLGLQRHINTLDRNGRLRQTWATLEIAP